MPRGAAICAAVAGPPSPEKPNVPVPATVVIVPVRRHPPDAVVARVREHHAAVRKQRHAVDEVELGRSRGTAVAGEARRTPCPATVVMRPSRPTRRTEGKERRGEDEASVRRDGDPARMVDRRARGRALRHRRARRRRCRRRWRSSPAPGRSARSPTGPERARTTTAAAVISQPLIACAPSSTRWEANRPMRRVSSVDEAGSGHGGEKLLLAARRKVERRRATHRHDRLAARTAG